MTPSPPSLYVHVPFCAGKCAYCAFYSERYDPALAHRWLAALETEITLVSRDLQFDSLKTIYLGGGTPTILEPPVLKSFLALIAKCTAPAIIKEWTIEANPGTLSRQKLKLLRQAGVTRISLGVQSFQDRVLLQVGRPHTSADTVAALYEAKKAGFNNIGLDLIAGLPGVSRKEWREGMERVVSLDVQHVSVYALTLEPATRLSRAVQAGACLIPDEETMLRLLEDAENILSSAAYVRYEISNYCKPGSECLHNLNCWRGLDYIGFGPAASSRIGLRRWTNQPDLNAYISALARGVLPQRDEEILNVQTDAAERLAFAFRLAEGVDFSTVQTCSPGQKDRWLQTLLTLARDELVEMTENGRWRLTRKGRNFADHVASELLSS